MTASCFLPAFPFQFQLFSSQLLFGMAFFAHYQVPEEDEDVGLMTACCFFSPAFLSFRGLL